MMRLFVLCVLLQAVAAAISPEEIAAARQACTHQCQDNDKVVMAKCMRACWKNFFDGHQSTTTTHGKKHVAAATHAPKKVGKVHAVKPKMAHAAAAAHAAPAAAPHSVKVPATHKKARKVRAVRSAFAERKPDSAAAAHPFGRMGPKSMASLLRAGASSLGINAGLLVCLLTAGAFLMA